MIEEIELRRYDLKFKTPFITARGALENKPGYAVVIKTDDGSEYTGDAAPFKKLGTESFQETFEVLSDFISQFNKSGKAYSRDDIIKMLKPLEYFPAARTGFEHAWLAFITGTGLTSLEELTGLNPKSELKINAVIGFCDEFTAEQTAEEIVDKGFGTIKLKAGRADSAEDIRVAKRVCGSVGKKAGIRLDANASWRKAEAVQVLEALSDCAIEYVEEPAMDAADFPAIRKKTGIAAAADESAAGVSKALNIINNRLADYLIIKPVLLGGFLPSAAIIRKALDAGIKPVVTSSFESYIGKRMNTVLASLIPGETAMGLGVDNLFAVNYGEDIYPIKDGRIKIEEPEL